VNPANWNESEAAAFGSHYAALACGGADCPPCSPPLRGRCTVMDGCEDAYTPAPGAGCKVGGVFYADGSPSIPDPVSCNTCTCADGKLSCTDLACPRPCSAGTKLATSCAQCGFAGSCDVVEHACRPTCVDACAEGLCVEGVCVVDSCE
jgi:hypothetical protein